MNNMNKPIIIYFLVLSILIISGCSNTGVSKYERLLEQVKSDNDQSLCNSLPDNIFISSKRSDVSYRAECEYYFLLQTDNISGCERYMNIGMVDYPPSYGDRCYTSMAVKKKDPLICDNVNDFYKNDCIYEVNRKEGNIDYCESRQPGDYPSRNECLFELATYTLDISTCNMIIDENDYISKNMCIYLVALNKKDKLLCEQLVCETADCKTEEECIRVISKLA